MDYNKVFESFNHLKILVIGDVMIDAYFFGKVDRISPEAPVPVVSVHKKERRPGGAANVALNLKSLGAKPILCSVIGDDLESEEFLELLQAEALVYSGIISETNRKTTVKTRIIGNNQQILRVDYEETNLIQTQTENRILKFIENNLEETDAIIFEDYNKGLLTPFLIESVIKMANEKGIPTVVDPKKENFLAYKDVTLFKPNRKEMFEGLKSDLDQNELTNVKNACLNLKKELGAEMVMTTLSEAGIIITDGEEFNHFPAYDRKIKDVSGAGDTVISVATLCLALDLPMDLIAKISNIAGGLVCEHVGVIPIDKEILLAEMLQVK